MSVSESVETVDDESVSTTHYQEFDVIQVPTRWGPTHYILFGRRWRGLDGAFMTGFDVQNFADIEGVTLVSQALENEEPLTIGFAGVNAA